MSLTGNEYVISLNKLLLLKVNEYVSESQLYTLNTCQIVNQTNTNNTQLSPIDGSIDGSSNIMNFDEVLRTVNNFEKLFDF